MATNGRADDAYRREVIDPGDRVSRLGHQVCIDSHGNSPAITVVPDEPDNFRGPVGYVWKPHILGMMADQSSSHWTMRQDTCCDGAGGKPGFFTLRGETEGFAGLGWEIITMTADDMARSGRLPVIMTNQPDIQRVTPENFPLIEAMFSGYGNALRQAGLVNIAGETAIMQYSITAFSGTKEKSELVLTWSGTCTGLCHRDLRINPASIKPGMPIVGFFEPGYRCNGGTFLMKTLLNAYRSVQDIREDSAAMELVRKLTVPSQSYAGAIARLVGWNSDGSIGEPIAKICGIAHITGGGVWGKFGEILPSGVGASLDAMPRPAEVLLAAQDLSLIWTPIPQWLTDWQGYSTLHGGCGALLVVASEEDAATVIREVAPTISAQVVGYTTNSSAGLIEIKSRYLQKPGETLRSDQPE